MLKLKLRFYFQRELRRNSHIEINFVAHVQKRNCYSIAGNCYEDSNNDPLVIMHPEGNIYLDFYTEFIFVRSRSIRAYLIYPLFLSYGIRMMMFKRRSTPIKTSIAVEATSPKIGKT